LATAGSLAAGDCPKAAATQTNEAKIGFNISLSFMFC